MKRISRIATAAIAVITLVACNNLKESNEPALNFEKELVFTASREGVSPDTKTVRMDDGSTWWNASEEISVFYGSGTEGGNKLVSQNNTLQEVVEFSGPVSMSGSGKEFWAVYPYSDDNACDGTSITTVIPDAQIGSEGNFSGDAFPAVAKSSTNVFAFWNICGGVKFSVSRSDIKSVTFKGNGGEVLAGKVRVSFNADGKPEVVDVLDGKTEVTFNAPDGDTFKVGKYYYLTLLPTLLDGGFTMTFNTATEAGSEVSNTPKTVKRSIFGVLKDIDSKVSEWKSTTVEPEWIDLGLPSGLKWATFNVGATKPEEYGDYFAWGETEPKSDYSWSTYKWCNGSSNTITKYCPLDRTDYWDGPGNPDGKREYKDYDYEDDAARANWGGSWRMPTYAEWMELLDNCDWTWTNQNGVNGWLITSKTNSNSIFFPAAGGRGGTSLSYVGTYGYYWSSSLLWAFQDRALFFMFTTNSVSTGSLDRSVGLSVRPVYVEEAIAENVTVEPAKLTLSIGRTVRLKATVSPMYANQTVEWTSTDDKIARVDANGLVTCVSEGATRIIARSKAYSVIQGFCDITVKETAIILNGHECIDLGLPSGLKWATCNVGATKPDEYGEYFAWGETQPKANYSWSTYIMCNGSNQKLTEYCTNSLYWDSTEPMDNKILLDPEDDAARTNWGSNWRMPSKEDFDELIGNCTWTWTTWDGVNGVLVTGSNGNGIFLPAAGSRYNTSLSGAVSYGYYWSSSLGNGSPYNADYVYIDSENVRWTNYDRSHGHSVRPVYNDPIHPESVTLNKSTLSLYVGYSEQLAATVIPENSTDKSVVWSSNNAEVATVDEAGNVTALKEGTATITVTTTLGGKAATCEVTVTNPPMIDGHEYIDLGLSVKWSTCNVGATKPEDYGDHFAWGETKPKESYSWSTYKWCNGASNKLTKYCTHNPYWDSSEPMDNRTVLDSEDDAAHVNWGGSWRMPTDTEWTELRENCTWTWTTKNGVKGHKVTSKKNNNSIFLPAAGERSDDLYSAGSGGYYWSSFLPDPQYAWSAYFTSGAVLWCIISRSLGRSVRPVYGDRIHPESISLNKSSISLCVSDSEQLIATISPANATDKAVTWSSDRTDVATVDWNGIVTAVSTGAAIITVTTIDGTKTATCEVTVEPKPEPEPEAVDLGLSVKWATFNVGATKPEKYGDYFAWGETAPKEIYDWSTYKWCDGSSITLAKYNNNSSYGTVDNKTVLDPEDDAATVNWGGSWRMPTDAEWTELRENCTWIWTTHNGVNGRLVTSNKEGYTDKSIFLPAAGYRYSNSLGNAGARGYYWSSSLNTDYPRYAWRVYFNSDNVYRSGFNIRSEGKSVRPVSD